MLPAPTIPSTLRAMETLVGPFEIIISGGAKGRAALGALISFQMMRTRQMRPPGLKMAANQSWVNKSGDIRRKLMCHRAELNFFVPVSGSI